jgi:hypothetical protein
MQDISVFAFVNLMRSRDIFPFKFVDVHDAVKDLVFGLPLDSHVYVVDEFECIIAVGTLTNVALEISLHVWLYLLHCSVDNYFYESFGELDTIKKTRSTKFRKRRRLAILPEHHLTAQDPNQ